MSVFLYGDVHFHITLPLPQSTGDMVCVLASWRARLSAGNPITIIYITFSLTVSLSNLISFLHLSLFTFHLYRSVVLQANKKKFNKKSVDLNSELSIIKDRSKTFNSYRSSFIIQIHKFDKIIQKSLSKIKRSASARHLLLSFIFNYSLLHALLTLTHCSAKTTYESVNLLNLIRK